MEIPDTDSKLFLSFDNIDEPFRSKYVGVRVGERKIAPGEPKTSSSKVGRLVNRPVGDFVGVFINLSPLILGMGTGENVTLLFFFDETLALFGAAFFEGFCFDCCCRR